MGRPAGSGATPTGYLVYRSGSKSGYLSKPFADRTLSITESDNGSYVYKVYACTGAEANPDCGPAASVTVTVRIPDTDNDGILDNLDTDDDNDGMSDVCENRYGFNPLDAVDGGTTNTDGDGASNVHECLHGTDPTATPANTVLPDTDRDGMYDAWESNNGLDPDDPADALLNDDGDGYTNLEEFTDRTDPQWADSNRGSIPELQFGFNDSYTVQVGMINQGDMLNDILVRNPTAGILPSVSDFVLIQKREGGFEIKDPDAESYTIPTTLTDISSKATVVDINDDGVKDLVLTELDSDTAVITDADDQIVYGNYHERYTIPEKHIALTATRKKFFEELSGWIDNANYFDVDVAVSTTLDIDEAENSDETPTRSTGPLDFINFGYLTILKSFFENNVDKCIGLSPEYCYILSNDGLWGRLDPFILDQIRMRVVGTDQIYFDIRGGSSSSRPTTVNFYDTSAFDQDARLLALNYLKPIRDSGSLQPGSIDATIISDMLETVLEVPVLNNRLLGVGNGALPKAEDHTSYTGIVREMIQSVKFQHDRLTLPAPQNQVTKEERESSPDRDVIMGLPACGYLSACNVDDFLEEQIDSVNTRLDELHEELARVTYATSEDAAIAIHNSDLHKFAHQVGIEILVIIDDTSNPVRISGVYTDFNTIEVELRSNSIGKDVWHNHPNLSYIWQGDAVGYVNNFGQDICRETGDFTVYASGANLTRAEVKQVIGITDTASYQFMYDEFIETRNTWNARTSPFSSESDEVEVSCP